MGSYSHRALNVWLLSLYMMFSRFTRVVEYQQNLTFSSQIFHHVDINIVRSEAIIYSFIMVNNASLLHTISMGF